MSAEFHHPVRLPVDELLKQCSVRHARRSGPGGQHRNKTESAVVLHHKPTGIEGQASERRSQVDNQRNAVKRLRMNLALHIRSRTDAAAAPSELWRSRCVDGRIVCSAEHADFPVLIAEALDVVADHHGHTTSSAEQLGCTASQLLKFLAKEAEAFLMLNEIRRCHGLPARRI